MAERRLFDRDVIVNVGGLRIASRLLDATRQELKIEEGTQTNTLKVVFGIAKTVKKEPNKCDLILYNLKKSNRIALQKKKQEVIIEAGYVGNTSILFEGQLEYSSSVQNGRDWVTSLQSSDGTGLMQSKRINKSFKGPARATDILNAAAKALGVKPGNLKKAIKRGSVRGNLSEFTNGIVLSGKADKVLDSVAKSMGYFYSIQDGQLLLLSQQDFLGTTATVISPETGMVGSPEPGEGGFVNVRTLIQPNLLPAHRVEIRAEEASGFYRIERVDFTGDTWGSDWFADLECRPLGGAS